MSQVRLGEWRGVGTLSPLLPVFCNLFKEHPIDGTWGSLCWASTPRTQRLSFGEDGEQGEVIILSEPKRHLKLFSYQELRPQGLLAVSHSVFIWAL